MRRHAVRRHREGVPRRHQAEDRRPRPRSRHQHASPRRSHRRQRRVPRRGEEAGRAGRRAGAAEAGRGGGRRTPPRRSSRTRRSTRRGRRSSATRPSPRSTTAPVTPARDAIVHFERAHVVHMGDLLFYERHPRVDRAAGASIQNWMKILEKVQQGHARRHDLHRRALEGRAAAHDGSARRVLRFRDYFDAVLALTRKGIAQGQTKEALVATTATAGLRGLSGRRRAVARGRARRRLRRAQREVSHGILRSGS